MRVYEMFLKFLGESRCVEKDIIIDINEFKSLMMLEANYPTYKQFNQRILKVVINDINLNSDLKVSVKTQGRPVKTLIFSVKKNVQLEPVQQIEKKSETLPAKIKKDRATYNKALKLIDLNKNGKIFIDDKSIQFVQGMIKIFEREQTYSFASEKQMQWLESLISTYRV